MKKKKDIAVLKKFIDVKKKVIDFKKQNSDLKKDDIKQKTDILDSESILLSKTAENAKKQRNIDYQNQKAKIDRKMIRNDVATGKKCHAIGLLASICSCGISIIGMYSHFPNGVACFILCLFFLFFGIANYFSNTVVYKNDARFVSDDKYLHIKKLTIKLPNLNNCGILKIINIMYMTMSIMSNYMFFDMLIVDNSCFGFLLKVLFSSMFDLVAFSLSNVADKFINLDYNKETIEKITGVAEQFAYFSDEKNGTEIKVQDTEKISTGDEKSVPILDVENGTKSDEKLVQYENEKPDEIKPCTDFFGTKHDEKLVQNDVESVPKKNENCTKNNRTKNEQIASAMLEDCKHNLADFEFNKKGENQQISKKIIFKCLSENIKKKLNIKSFEDIKDKDRVFREFKKLAIEQGFLSINDKGRYVIDIDYDKASKTEKILKEADLLKK